MKVAHVVPGISEEASGPSHSVPGLCSALRARGLEIQLHTVGRPPARAVDPELVTYHRDIPVGIDLRLSPGLKRTLKEVMGSARVVHTHSLWQMPDLYPARLLDGGACKLVASPRGTLSEWALRQSRLRKRLLWVLAQRNALRAAHCLHATSEMEFTEIRSAGLSNPVAVIPNGIDVPSAVPERPSGPPYRILFLSRIHPKKGLRDLLEAWRRIQDTATDWELEVVGPAQGRYAKRMIRLAAATGCRRVSFPGPCFGEDKARKYASSHLFVLPSSSENFGLVVAEALAHGTPAVVTRNAPWAGMVGNECGWWIEEGVKHLATALQEAIGAGATELNAMGVRGRQWVSGEFAWDRVAEMHHLTYRWIAGEAAPPDWVTGATDPRGS